MGPQPPQSTIDSLWLLADLCPCDTKSQAGSFIVQAAVLYFDIPPCWSGPAQGRHDSSEMGITQAQNC